MKTTALQRLLAWLLIAMLGSPPWSAWARDTDIYRSVVTASSAAEPNVLLMLDTSDSMNLPEGWREYPGGYDSHVEYLWNDLFTIGIAEVTTEADDQISTGNGYVADEPSLLLLTDSTFNNAFAGPDPRRNRLLIPRDTFGSHVYNIGDTITLSDVPIAALNGTYTIADLTSAFLILNFPAGTIWNSPDPNKNCSTAMFGYCRVFSPPDATTGARPPILVNFPGSVMPQPTKPLGFWGGDTPEARRQIWQAALTYAIFAEPGDPGPRYQYRNYRLWSRDVSVVDGKALYWLPAGTAETDHRLWSIAYNRFLGVDNISRFGSVNGNADPIMRGGINFGNLSTQYSAYNKCQASSDQLTPSTVFAPSTVNKNTGKYLGDKWQRYERYLNLDASLAASYPGSDGKTIDGADYDGYLNANRDFNGNAFGSPPAVAQPLPIRQRRPGDSSYGGWTDLRPDWGGYHFMKRVWDVPAVRPVLDLYVAGADTTGLTSAQDWTMATYKYLPVPGYYDTSGGKTIGGTTRSRTRSCTWTGQSSETDAGHLPVRNPLSLSYGGTCTDNGIACSGSDCSGISAPGDCSQTLDDHFYSRDNNNCHWNDRSQLDTMTFSGCHWEGQRLPVPGEGVGDYYYGGTCVGNCTGGECPDPVDGGTNYCVNSTAASQIFGLVTYNNVLQTTDPAAGCTTRTDNGILYYYGGSCAGDYRLAPGTAGVWPFTGDTSACDKSVTWDSKTVDDVVMTDVRTDSISAGCRDKNDPKQSCDERHGGGCDYMTCTDRVSSRTSGGTDYTFYNRVPDVDSNMVHDCVADGGGAAGIGPFMARAKRDFGAPWSSTAGNSATNKTWSYDTAAARGITDATPAYDVYSVNYLNWKFGAKSNGNPIGRKTRLQTAKDALSQLVATQDGVRFGLMVFNGQDNTHNTEGGNVVYAMQRMGTKNRVDISAMSAAQRVQNNAALRNRDTLTAKINSLVAIAQTPLTESLYEAYLYFNGAAPRFGRQAAVGLGARQISAGCDRKAFDPGDPRSSDCLASPPLPATYHSPMLDLLGNDGNPAACQKNFVVLVSDGGPENDWSANDLIKALRYEKSATEVISPRTDVNTPTQSTSFNQFVQPDGTPFGPVDVGSTASDGGYVWLDELAYYMANAKVSPASIAGVQSVVTYTIGFAAASTAVLQNTAGVGRGQYFSAEDPSLLYSKLSGALDAIRSWQPIAGGGSVVPISALNRAENSDKIYLGFFGPSLQTRWDGSLKKYLLSTVTTPGDSGYCGTTPDGDKVTLCMTGQTLVTNDIGESVWNIEWISKGKDPATGLSVSKVNEHALSFWSPSTSTPDGGSARKGGSGQTLMNGRTPANRPIYTFLSGGSANGGSSSTALSDNPLAESNSTITKSLLGNPDMGADKRATLINFARGGDPTNSSCADAAAGTACNTWRDWAHADILHSKPVILNYTQDKQYAFYLSTDGTLHAVDTVDGSEKWAYTIEEALPLQDTLMTDLVGEHTIVADGSPSIFFDDANRNGLVEASTDRVTLYFGQRRGGSAYYALDITDEGAPKFLWKIVGGMGVAGKGMVCVGSAVCRAEAQYDELGQTWSFPGVGKVRAKLTASAGRPTPVLIVGGGYDPNQDNDPVVDADSMGRALYIIDGYNGSVVKKFDNVNTVNGMSASIPSDVTAVNADLDAQNLLDRVYVGDTAGNLYRFDIDDALSANWTGGRIAQLSDAYALPDTAPNRKILFPPTLVKQRGMQAGALVAFDAVYVGSGDREHPLKSDGTADRLFMIKDKVGVDRGYALNAGLSDLVDITHLASAEAYAPLNTASTKGWYYSLPGAGEKVVSMPTVLNNVLRFSTYAPLENINSCVPSGRGQLYGMDAYSGTPLDGVKYKMLTTNPHIFAGFFSQGYIGHAVPIVFGDKLYVLQVTESGQILPGAAEMGTIAKVYWYREAER